jgi:hypothetical protein
MTKLKGNRQHIANQPKMKAMSTTEVAITYSPFKEIVILEKTRFNTPEDIARFTSVIAGGKLAGLYWVDGVVFLYFPLPASTTAVAKELLENGKVYWTFVGYALMPKYAQIIETKEKMIVPVVDISSDSILRKVAQWLKEQNSDA